MLEDLKKIELWLMWKQKCTLYPFYLVQCGVV